LGEVHIQAIRIFPKIGYSVGIEKIYPGISQTVPPGVSLIEVARALQEGKNKLEVFRQKHKAFAMPEQKSRLLQQRSAIDNAIKAAQTQR